MTAALSGVQLTSADAGVYAPQEDSYLLVDVMTGLTQVSGSRVLDLCTGSGFVAINAALHAAASVTAFDICPRAVRSARTNARAAGVNIDVRLGSLHRAQDAGPFDLVVCNPPYVPHEPGVDTEPVPGPRRAWNAGADGRLVLDPLCESADKLLASGGTMLVVQSEFAAPQRSLDQLRAVGLRATVAAEKWIPFGPVVSAREQWLQRTNRLPVGRREEKLVVIRADKR